MTTIKLFLKWLILPYGTTKVRPTDAIKYMPGGQIAGPLAESKLGRFYREQKCVICGVQCWAYRKSAPPICTTWPCYRDYYLNQEKYNEKQT